MRSILLGMIFVSCFAMFTSAHAVTLEGADQECVPAIVNKCGCGEVVDPKTGECISGTNKYQCICSQPDPGGGSTTGTCDATEKCHTITTNGKAPSSVTAQQMQTNNGTSANGASAGSSVGTPQVSSNSGITAPPTTPSQTPEQTSASLQNSSGNVPANSSLLQDAYQQYQLLTGESSPSAPPAQSTDNSSVNSQPSGESSWLSSAQQYQIQSELSPSSGNTPTNMTSGSGVVPGENGGATFQSTNGGTPPDNLPFSSQALQNIQAANASVNLTPSEQAAQDLQAIQDTAKSVGGWVQSTFSPTDQSGQSNPNDTTASSPGSNPYLADQRASLMAPLDPNSPNYNPALRDEVAAVIGHETDNPLAAQAVLESMVNRSLMNGYTSLDSAINSGFYGPVNTGAVAANLNTGVSQWEYGLADPAIQAVTNGSNICNFCTDQGQINEIQGFKVNIGGEYFGYIGGNSTWSDQQTQLASIYNASYYAQQSSNDFASAQPVPYAWAGNISPMATDGASAPIAETNLANSSGSTFAWTGQQMVSVDWTNVASIYGSPQTGQASSDTLAQSTPYPPLPEQQVESQIPVPEPTPTNPQAAVEAANQLENQNAQDQILNDRLAQADQETNAFNNPSMPNIGTNIPSGEAVTQNVYNSAIADASNNVPPPTAAEANLPTQAEMQADLLKNSGQDFSSLNANSFYQTVQGSQFAESGVAVPSGTVTNAGGLPELGTPYSAGTITSEPLPLSDQQVEVQAQAINNAGLQDRLVLADQQTSQYEQGLANASSQVPVPNMSNLPTGDQITQEFSQAADHQIGQVQSFPSGQVESSPIAPVEAPSTASTPSSESTQAPSWLIPFLNGGQTNTAGISLQDYQTVANQVSAESAQTGSEVSSAPTLADRVSGAVTSAANSVQDLYQSVTDSLPQYALDKSTPPPTTFDQTGEQVTSNIQQTVASQQASNILSSALTPDHLTPVSPEVTTVPSPQPIAADQIVTPEAYLASAFADTQVPSTNLPSWATVDTNAVLNSVSAVTPQNLQQTANDFSSGNALSGLDQSPAIENSPLPEARPAEAGTTGININGCGGVCEEGNTGTDVKAIQQFLNSQGYSLKVDGIYGPQTESAVETFQKGNNIQVDGVVGPQTVGVMNSVAASEGALVPATQSGEGVTNQVLQAAQVQQSAAQSPATPQTTASADSQPSASDQSAKPEATYTLSNAGDLRGEFLANPVTAAFTPDSIKQELQAAYNSGADTVTLTQSQLDSVRWDLMNSNQLTQIQNILGTTGYQIPTSAFSAQPSGMQDIFNIQQASADASALRVCSTGPFCFAF